MAAAPTRCRLRLGQSRGLSFGVYLEEANGIRDSSSISGVLAAALGGGRGVCRTSVVVFHGPLPAASGCVSGVCQASYDGSSELVFQERLGRGRRISRFTRYSNAFTSNFRGSAPPNYCGDQLLCGETAGAPLEGGHLGSLLLSPSRPLCILWQNGSDGHFFSSETTLFLLCVELFY